MPKPGSPSKSGSAQKTRRGRAPAPADPSTAAAPARISRFAVPALADMPEDVRAGILAVQEKAGFVPNVFLALAHRPEEFRAFFAHHDALMERRGGLSAAQREMIVVATSAANQCHYCVIAHGAILRIRSKQPLLADQIAVNYRRADISAEDRLMLDFAMKVAGAAATLESGDLRVLREAGFSEDDIWDIGAIAAFFAQSNRLANLADIRPNSEFYTMGRNP